MKKYKKQHKHSRCLNMLKLKQHKTAGIYKHYQVKQSSKNCDSNITRATLSVAYPFAQKLDPVTFDLENQ